VAHACNPSYLGGRHQEDHSSNAAQTNSSQVLVLKMPNRKRVGRVAQMVACLTTVCETQSSNPDTIKKKKTTQTNSKWAIHILYFFSHTFRKIVVFIEFVHLI
jgi:hypothetical protein